MQTTSTYGDIDKLATQNICEHGDRNAIYRILTHENANLIFWYVCTHDRLQMALWLLAIAPDINVHAGDELVFRWTCDCGHLPIVQWLLAIRPDIDIHANHEWAFVSSCDFDNLPIAQWLVAVNSSGTDRYYLINDVGYIYNQCDIGVWNYVHDLGYGYLHYRNGDDLDTIVAHHRMAVAQSRCKSARKIDY